jgi:uncharacterized repeat protein (TIGR01451 family)
VNTPYPVETISLDGSRRFHLLSRREKRDAFPKRKFRQRISASANHGLAPNRNRKQKEIMNTSIQHPGPNGIVQPSGDSSRSEAILSAWRKLPGRFTFVALLAGLFLLLFSAPVAAATLPGTPPGCAGSGLGIFLDTPSGDSHVGCTICYSITIINGGIGPKTFCDASNITAFVVTPDGTNHPINLAALTTAAWEGGGAHPGRTYLSNGQWDYYTNVVCYTILTNNIRSDGTVRATAQDIAIILQNDTPSASTNEQGVNTEVSLPGLNIAVSCTNSVGENGAITFGGTVTNTGNNTLFNVTVFSSLTIPNLVATFPILNVGQVVSFSGFWVPLNPCSLSTNTFVAQGNDSFTNCPPPQPISASTNAICSNTLTPGIKVTKLCFDPVPPGFPLTFGGSVSNTGNVTLTNIVVVNNQPVPNTVVFTLASLKPGAGTNFTASYAAPTNCSVTDTLTARALSVCGVAVTNSGSNTCTILTTPQITVAALCPIAPVLPGGLVTYSVTVSNAGYFTLTNISVFSDQLGPPNNPVKTVASLASGASTNFNVGPYTVPANACTVSNTFSATGKDPCTLSTVTNTASPAICPVTTAPAIAVTLACPVVLANAGGPITYTGTVTNSGNVTLINVYVVNNQPSNNTPVTGPLTLAPHAFANFTATFIAPTNACSVSSTVTASGNDNCYPQVVVTTNASATCPLNTTPLLTITQNCPATYVVAPGGLLVYSVTVSNAGNITITNVVVLNNLSGATPILTNATLAPGTVTNFTGSYFAPTNCSTTSTSTVTGRSICGIAVTNTVSSTCPIQTSPAIVVAAACPTNLVVPNGSLTYSVMVTNTGNITLTNVVVVSDRPAANTPVIGPLTLAPGASTNFTAGPYPVPANACMVTTTFTVTGKDCNPTSVTNTASPTCPVTTAPAIAVTLACPAVLANAGGPITYTGTVTNSGNVILNNVTVVDSQSGTVLTVPSLAPHLSAPFTATFTAPTNACSVSSTVTVSGSDNCYPNVIVTTNASATCPLNTTPGIQVTKLCYEQRVAPGQTFTFSGSVSNTGNITLTNIVVVNNQPSNNTPVFTLASLAPGAVTNFIASYVAPTNCSVTDTLIATGRSICGVAVSSTNSATCPIFTTPAIVVTVFCPTNQVGQGGQLTFSGTVSNAGNITLTNIIVVNNWPFSNVIFTAGSLAPGATTNFTGSYMVPSNCCVAWLWVVASGQGCDGFTVTDTDSRTCAVFTSPGIVVTKVCATRRRLLRPGEILTYSGSVSNAGNITLYNVTVVDNQPYPGSLVLGTNILAPGEFATFAGSYPVPVDFCGNDTVTASGYDLCSGALVTNSVTAICPIAHNPRIGVTKQCPPDRTLHGGTLIFTGTVTNLGDVTLVNVYVVNDQPSNNTPVIGPITLSPGAGTNFTGSYTAPLVCCEIIDTLTARGQDQCSFSNVTATATAICPTLYTPGIALVQDCPPNLLPGSCYCFSGYVTNTGDAILTNVLVFSSALPCQDGLNNLPSGATLDGFLRPSLLGPIDLAPGQAEPYYGCLIVPSNICEVTISVTSQETCEGTFITNTISCPVTTTPCISITENCQQGPVSIGDTVVFTGYVCNCGNITLTNVFVYSSQPSNSPPRITFALIGSHDSLAAISAQWVLGPITLDPGACSNFMGSYIATGGSLTTNSIIVTNPPGTLITNIVSVITTNTVISTTNAPMWFGTIDPVLLTYSNRFNVPSNLHALMYEGGDPNWGPTLFYSTQHPGSGADTFDTISTIANVSYPGQQYVGFVTNWFALTASNYDALTFAAPDVGYGGVNFYYIRHDNSGAYTFGEIIAQGASSSADLWPIVRTGYTGLAFAAANLDANGANMFYYVRNDTNGVSQLGIINPTPGGIETDLYAVGTNSWFDALVYVDLTPIPGWGTDYFAYLRHDNTGSIIGTIDPLTHVATDRMSFGTNFLSALTFTTTAVGYGPNLFYYLGGSGVATYTTNYSTNTTVTRVTTYTTNIVVSLTTTNTVRAFGWSICQSPNDQPVTAAADCSGPIGTVVLVIGTPTVNSDGFFGLTFPTVAGTLYWVQYKDALTDPAWTNLPGMPLTGAGGPWTSYDPSPAALHPSRFYRIMSMP